jgi:hypothetical protein
MPPLHPALLELRTELERQGSVVVCHGDYICLRLPLVASVRIRLNGGQLHFEPRFGPLSRGTSLVVTPVLAALAVVFVHTVAAPATIVMAFAGILSVLYDTQRLVMTEGAMTRLQQLWSTRQAPKDVVDTASPMAALPGVRGVVPLPGRPAELVQEGAPLATPVARRDR